MSGSVLPSSKIYRRDEAIPEAIWDRSEHRVYADRTGLSRLKAVLRTKACETKPICRHRRRRARAGEDAGGASRGSLRQTNPICPAPAGKGPGCQGHKHCRPWGQARQTKPICPARAGSFAVAGDKRTKRSQFPACGQERARTGRVVRAGTAGPKRAKQSQSLPRNPKGKYLVKKELWYIWRANGLGKTKPIAGQTAGGKGRQGCRRRRWDPSCETNPICPAPTGKDPGRQGPQPNKANSRGQAQRGNPPPRAGHTPVARPAAPWSTLDRVSLTCVSRGMALQ